MKFLSFFDEFPELIGSEFRNIFIFNNDIHKHIPPGNYAFLEMFCPDVDCDCRKVIINIITADPPKTWVTLNYGWESEEYYKNWWGKNHFLYKPMSGVVFDPPTNDPLKNEFLKIFQDIIQTDKKYANRIETHYLMFKEAMKMKKVKQEIQFSSIEKVERNELCPCNSGKKFKKCCLFSVGFYGDSNDENGASV